MTTAPQNSNAFIDELIQIIQENISDESFGVSELASKVHMSRSNLLRKIQKSTGLTASVFIRNVRLSEAQLLLQKNQFTVSEIAYQVGFSSVSYFVKCYREEFGYPPGEEVNQSSQIELTETEITQIKKPAWRLPAIAIVILVVLSIIFQLTDKPEPTKVEEKSILVLPFKNDSPDTSNVYLVNGLMEAILNNLQKVEDLRVVSRTTSEFYRNSSQTLPEIAEEVDVVYFIEGSGQKQGDQILLTVQLIKGETDDHLWSEQYLRNTSDIFSLQAEVAKDIAQQVEAKIKPEEIERIDKVLTTNLVAYDHYLKGQEAIFKETFEGIETGLVEFKNAIDEDPEFAEAYAYIAIGYYYDDAFRGQFNYSDEIDWYASKAYKLDSLSPLSLTAKGLNALKQSKFDSAVTYLEKVIELNPNSGRAYNTLSVIHLNYLYDTRKYLQYALKALQIDPGTQDSTTLSYTYLHLSNALIQTGFIELADEFSEKSMALDPTNLFSIYVHAYIDYAQDGDFAKAEKRMLAAYEMDKSRIDIVQEIAKLNYNEKNFEKAAQFYDQMFEMKAAMSVQLFESENIKAAYSYDQIGRAEEAELYYILYKNYADQDTSLYGQLSLAAYYASTGDTDQGMVHLKNFSSATGIPFWFILFLKDDPILNEMSDHPDFDGIIQKITDQFWKEHDEIREELTVTEVIIR